MKAEQHFCITIKELKLAGFGCQYEEPGTVVVLNHASEVEWIKCGHCAVPSSAKLSSTVS